MGEAQSGDTGWGRRWNEVLDSLGWGGEPDRSGAGEVRGLRIAAGLASARVQGSQAGPYEVAIAVKTFSAGEWVKVEGALAGRAGIKAGLLGGWVPREIEGVFEEAGLSLFPAAGDIAATCSCPGPTGPCRHVIAVGHVLGRRLAADPFLLLEWRGKGRKGLLSALAESAPRANPAGEEDSIPADPALFWALDPAVVRLPLYFAPPGSEAALLRRLGPLPFRWNRVQPQDRLVKCYRTVTRRALAELDEP